MEIMEIVKKIKEIKEIEHISINFFKKHPEFIDKGVLSSIDIFKIKNS